MHLDHASSATCENRLADATSRRVQRNTRASEPEWPCAIKCPDGCGALVWSAGNEQGRTLVLNTTPVAPGSGGYVVEPLYVGPSADVAKVKDGKMEASAKEFVEQADAWNWYATYESTLVTSTNSRFALHVTTCTRKTKKQRARALNGQTFGGCCKPRSERSAGNKSARVSVQAEEWLINRANAVAPNGQLYLFGTLYPPKVSATPPSFSRSPAGRTRKRLASARRVDGRLQGSHLRS